MHANPHTNLFGVTTHYGTHPQPPMRLGARLQKAADRTVTGALVAALAIRDLVRKVK